MTEEARPAPCPVPSLDKSADTLPHGTDSTGGSPAPAPDPAAPTVTFTSHESLSGASAGGPILIGHYTVVGKLGEGGMGTVYLAEDPKLGRKVAIKTMKADLAAIMAHRDRFVREARAAAAVESDYIVPILHTGDAADGTPFIAMPLLQGEMLDSRLKREPIADTGIVLQVAREVAEGLAAAHAKGVIHRDIKPGNIWLESDLPIGSARGLIRRCKILDFGLARSVDGEDVNITASGAILGTPAYMAPEQARGERVDHRADLFSLGVTLYRMATGVLPFQGTNAVAVLLALTTETPRPVGDLAPGMPVSLASLIDRLMSKDPSRRPQSAAEVCSIARGVEKDQWAKPGDSSEPPLRQVTEGDTHSLAVSVPPVEATATIPPPQRQSGSEKRHGPPARVGRRRRSLRGVVAGTFGLIALAAVLAIIVLRVETAEGTLVVEINDPAVEARVKQGKLILTDASGKERYALVPAVDRTSPIAAGRYSIRVEGADGLILDTQEFTLKSAGEVKVRVTLAPTVPPKKDDPDRRAAEYVLSIGGRVRINGDQKDIRFRSALPTEPFRLTLIDLYANTRVSDETLACLKGCNNLESVFLQNTAVGDKAVAYLQDCAELKVLFLWNTRVTDGCLVYLKNCKHLESLNLGRTRVTSAGLARVVPFSKLSYFAADSTEVDDAGLLHLGRLPNLQVLWLLDTKVSDTDLKHLEACNNLTYLNVKQTLVSANGPATFAKGSAKCTVETNDAIILASTYQSPDRKAATYVLSIGGSVKIAEATADVRAVGDLPPGEVALTEVNLGRNNKASDSGLAALKGCRGLSYINLQEATISDSGLAHLKDSRQLRTLQLQGTRVNDAGLNRLKTFENLIQLNLRSTKVTPKGVADLAKSLPSCRIEWDGDTIEPQP